MPIMDADAEHPESPMPVSPAPLKPYPMTSLVSSARRLTAKSLEGGTFRRSTAASWQEDAWEMYDLVGEQRFLASTLANRMGQAKLYVGKMPDDPLADPVPTDDETLQHLLDTIGGSAAGLSQLIQRMGVNLFIAGDGWLVGIPPLLMPEYKDDPDAQPELAQDPNPKNLDESDDASMADLVWRMLSVTEVQYQQGKTIKLTLGEDASEQIEVSPSDVYMIRVWRPHPRRWWEADSPTRSALPVLRELVGLTMHISAQIDSRLAGAGVFIVPQSAVDAMKRNAGLPEDSDEDPYTDALMKAMLTPIGDRSNASAMVPLVSVVPDDATGKFEFITFAKPLDMEARTLRDEAIRRLALGQDAPPELLLGTAGMNHWGAWLVREEVVTTHIAPPLALICDALTSQYLRPVMAELGHSQAEIEEHAVWFDTSAMVIHPNRASDAQKLFSLGVISDDSLREANGFDESDAPGAAAEDGEGGDKPEKGEPDEAAMKAIEIVLADPTLMRDPGLPKVVEQVRNAMYGTTTNTAPVETETEAEDIAAEEAAVDEADEVGVVDIVPGTAAEQEGPRTTGDLFADVKRFFVTEEGRSLLRALVAESAGQYRLLEDDMTFRIEEGSEVVR